MTVDIFVDANALLSVYETKGDDINDLLNLMDLSETGSFRLITTDIVYEEFYRNRDRVIFESISEFKKGKIEITYPSLIRHIDGYGELRRLETEIKLAKKKLYDHLIDLIEKDSLRIDELMSKYFDKAKFITHTQDMIKAAELRDKLGKDPGKPGQLGDHINWLMVLDECQDRDLCIVSDDGDFECRVNKGVLRRSLKKERSEYSNYDVYLSTSIRQAVSKFEEIAEKHERPRRLEAIKSLENSSSFASTHRAIASLNEFRTFSEDDINRILNAYTENTQVRAISCDDDVADFLRKLERYIKSGEELKHKYKNICESYLPEEEDDDWPF